MTRPVPFLAAVLALAMVVAACETAQPQQSPPGPGQTPLPGVDPAWPLRSALVSSCDRLFPPV